MTQDEKAFIKKHIKSPWVVQQLILTEASMTSYFASEDLPAESIEELLDLADIPFFTAFSDDQAYAFLPVNSRDVLKELNELLKKTGYYVAAVHLPGIEVKGMCNIESDFNLHHSLNSFKNMVGNIKTYMSFLIKPEFSQSKLDGILDELKNKSFNELSPLQKNQLKHFSEHLNI